MVSVYSCGVYGSPIKSELAILQATPMSMHFLPQEVSTLANKNKKKSVLLLWVFTEREE